MNFSKIFSLILVAQLRGIRTQHGPCLRWVGSGVEKGRWDTCINLFFCLTVPMGRARQNHSIPLSKRASPSSPVTCFDDVHSINATQLHSTKFYISYDYQNDRLNIHLNLEQPLRLPILNKINLVSPNNSMIRGNYACFNN